MTPKPHAPVFTPEEITAIRSAALQVWNECAYDILQSMAEETRHKNINRVTVSRAVAMEIALDANRAEDRLRSEMQRARKTGRPTVITEDLLTRMQAADYKTLIKIVKPAFPFNRYGM